MRVVGVGVCARAYVCAYVRGCARACVCECVCVVAVVAAVCKRSWKQTNSTTPLKFDVR